MHSIVKLQVVVIVEHDVLSQTVFCADHFFHLSYYCCNREEALAASLLVIAMPARNVLIAKMQK
jgi:hypothetical protein